MGQLFYGNAEPIIIPDRQLAYFKVIATTKLRRSESFTVSWHHVDDTPGARTTIWLQPAIPLRFVFDQAAPEELSSAHLRELAERANSAAGLTLDLAEDLDADLHELTALKPARVA